MAEWLDYSLKSVVEGRVGSENTVANYETVVRVHLKPGLGDVKLARLTPEQVDDFLASKARAGRSKSYVARMRDVASRTLSDAERRRLVTLEHGQALGHAEATRPARTSVVYGRGKRGRS